MQHFFVAPTGTDDLDFFLPMSCIATATGLATLNTFHSLLGVALTGTTNSVLCGRYTENISCVPHSCFDDGSTLFQGQLGEAAAPRPDGFIYYGALWKRALRATEAMMLPQ